MATIRWTLSPRPDTGVSNGVLGLWLFLAAEVMFFGSLLSSYVLLRLGNGALWAAEGLDLSWGDGTWKVLVLLSSSVVLQVAVQRAKAGRAAGRLVGASLLLGGVFLGARASELVGLASAGLVPRSGVATAMFYVVSGLHALHLLVVAVLLAAAAIATKDRHRAGLAKRLHLLTVAWHFFVAVWCVFYVLYFLT